MILIQSEFYLSGAVTNRHQCTQQDVQKVEGNIFPNAPSRLRYSQKISQALEKERYPGEIELENKEDNKD